MKEKEIKLNRRKNIRTQQFFQGEEKEVPQLMKLIKRKYCRLRKRKKLNYFLS